MQITQEDYDRYIIGWHITPNNHVWIGSTVGGYVETTDSGKYYSGENHYRAIIHRIKDIKKYEKMYLEAIKNEENH